MNMFRLGDFKSKSMVTWGGLKERTPTRRLRHLRTIQIRNWSSSMSSTGLIAKDYPTLDHSFPRCVICGFISGTS
jgi:hypothetical protein